VGKRGEGGDRKIDIGRVERVQGRVRSTGGNKINAQRPRAETVATGGDQLHSRHSVLPAGNALCETCRDMGTDCQRANAPSHFQDNKLNVASRCSHQAQLVALQIALLNAVPQDQQATCVLNLKSDEMDRTLALILNFPQALIVSRAYNYHADWANLIYHHCVLKGQTMYLKEFMTVNSLTPTIVQDCARR